MKQLFGLSALALPLFLTGASTEVHGLEWESTRFEHTAEPAEEKVSTTFSFKNAGDQAVTITDVRSSCGCTVPDLTKRTYQPGEGGELRVVFSVGGRIGRQLKTVTVTTDEVEKSTYTLNLEIEIPQLYSLDKRFVLWKRGDPPTPKTITIRIQDPERVQLGTVESRDDRLSAKLEPDKAPGVHRLVITPDDTGAAMQSTIVVKTSVSSRATKDIVIYALVR